MRSETNGHLQVQVPAKGGGFGTNYVPTRVCNVSGLEKPQTRVCGRVSKVERKRAPFRAFNLSQMDTGVMRSCINYNTFRKLNVQLAQREVPK